MPEWTEWVALSEGIFRTLAVSIVALVATEFSRFDSLDHSDVYHAGHYALNQRRQEGIGTTPPSLGSGALGGATLAVLPLA